jgi:hypothetical protein
MPVRTLDFVHQRVRAVRRLGGVLLQQLVRSQAVERIQIAL